MRLAAVLVLTTAVLAQGSGKYTNDELGVKFAGVYGWDTKFAGGSGAWTELAVYSEAALDARVVLQVRNNIYKTIDELRAALKKEFATGGEPQADKAVFKDIAFTDAQMKKGLKLKGIDASGNRVMVTEEGKKREHFVVVRTYFGKNRLFRIHCSAKRSRAKRVKDRFDLAMSSLEVSGVAEQAVSGTPVKSERGNYTCMVPTGFSVLLPARGSSDLRFVGRGIRVSVISYRKDGELIDHRDSLLDYYGDDIKLDDNDIKILGTDGFRGVLTRGGSTTLIVGVVKGGRFIRVHTNASKANLEEAKRVHEVFLKTMKLGR
jgi:hypothetical protein